MAQYRIPVEETFSWQRPIIDKDLSAPPATPAKGDRYIVAASPTGDWATHAGHIAWCSNATGPVWSFDVPVDGWVGYVKDVNKIYIFKDTAWSELAEGAGDMLKATYDTDNDGIVDKAETIDDGAGNSATAAALADAVTKKHAHTNAAVLDAIQVALTTALKTAYDGAVTDSHTHANAAVLDAIQVAFTTALKTNYDEAYSRRGSYDAALGAILMTI